VVLKAERGTKIRETVADDADANLAIGNRRPFGGVVGIGRFLALALLFLGRRRLPRSGGTEGNGRQERAA